MAKNDNAEKFFLGKGVLRVGGKDYDASEPLPLKEMDPIRVAELEKAGQIGEQVKKAAKSAPTAKENSEITALKKTVAELTEHRDNLQTSLETVTVERDTLQSEVDGLKADADPDKTGGRNVGPQGNK